MLRMLLPALAGVAVGTVTTASPMAAQIPNRFVNLRVLPQDTPRDRLVATMRDFSIALGVRCTHCHVGGDPATLEGVDFASDTLATKRVARVMWQMVQTINREYVSQVATGNDGIAVQCMTCHRGVARPEPLDRVIARRARATTPDSVAAEYRQLREMYFGSGAYDFGEQSLVTAALAVNRPGEHGATIRLLELNLEHHPNSATTHLALGQVLASAGDTVRAIASLERALALRPGNAFILEQLNRLRG